MKLWGTYAGTVEDDRDPDQVGRLKVRAPTVYGPANEPVNSVPTSDLPWALPAGLPAGGTPESGAIGWLPNVGDHVFVRFLDGEPEKPLWEWGLQDLKQGSLFPYWTRNPGGYTAGAAPKSAVLTRYGHSFDFQPDSTTWRTANGYKFRFTDTTGQLDVFVPNMVGLVGNLKFTGTAYKFFPSQTFDVNTKAASIEANTFDVSSITSTLTAIAANYLRAPHIELGPDGQATDPVIRLSDLAAVCSAIMSSFNAHLHIGNLGKPTSPPTSPMTLSPTASATTFSA